MENGGTGDKKSRLSVREDDDHMNDFDGRESSTNHKRSLSGTLLARWPFLRNSFEGVEDADGERDVSTGSWRGDEAPNGSNRGSGGVESKGGSNAVMQRMKTRKRKGSLRKTALLGGSGKIRTETRPRTGTTLLSVDTNVERGAFDDPNVSPQDGDSPALSPEESFEFGNYDFNPASVSQEPGSTAANVAESATPSDLRTMTTSPPFGESSTTDEDEGVTFPRQSGAAAKDLSLSDVPSSGSESYFPMIPGTAQSQRRRPSSTATHASSPLSALPLSAGGASSDEWDYSETERWGWFILIVTWLVFVTGMGSCLEVWSWAWDVGETPYAPPELEDDPTLPIVGYYPALIILTSVMAWVWVVGAWMGMKYFRHAKISGDDF